ncbi:hypothetical protein [Pseudoduganella sp. GCM10020061]|uniref:hypothetical protein n=1 Tax=Pseudoduganella sp. GCM10020061 TaxID=3317345 RepID=UPI00363D304E
MPRFLPAAVLASLCVLLLLRSGDVRSANIGDGNPDIKLRPPTKRRDLGTVPCSHLQKRVTGRISNQPRDAMAVFQLLRDANDDSTLKLFEVLPDEFMWWMRSLGEVSMFSLGVATHETAHAFWDIAYRCGSPLQYYFRGSGWPVERALTWTANYSIVAAGIPRQFKQARPGNRYQHYIEGSREHFANDLSVLLSELNAYVETANLEIKLARTKLFPSHRPDGPISINSNVGGSADFMLFTLAYLHALKSTDPDGFQALKGLPLFQAHLQRLWTSSEEMLCRASAYSDRAGGVLSIPSDALSHIYQSGFASILHDLNVKYAAEDSCLRFYWTSAPAKPALLTK